MSDNTIEARRKALVNRPKPEPFAASPAAAAYRRRYQAALASASWRPVQVREMGTGKTFAAEFVHIPSEAYGASGVGSDVLRVGARIVADAAPRNFAARFEIVGGTPTASAQTAPPRAPRPAAQQGPDRDEVRNYAMTHGLTELAAREYLEGETR